MSNIVYVIRNQHGLYLNKQQEWVDGRDAQSLFRCAHHDEAINTVFEVSAKDITLRAEALACPLDARKNPRVEAAGQLDFNRADADGDGDDVEQPSSEQLEGDPEPTDLEVPPAEREQESDDALHHSPAG